jgi:hypothetical protein
LRYARIISLVSCLSGHLQKDDIQVTLEKLHKRIDSLKGDLFASLQSTYSDFIPQLDAAFELKSRIEELSDDIQSLGTKIEGEVRYTHNPRCGIIPSLE